MKSQTVAWFILILLTVVAGYCDAKIDNGTHGTHRFVLVMSAMMAGITICLLSGMKL